MSRCAPTITLVLLLGLAAACTPFHTQPTLPPGSAEAADTIGTADTAGNAEPDNATFMPPPAESTATPVGEFRAEAIPGEIVRLEAIARNPLAGTDERSESWRRLALLYLSPQNSTRNLEQAATAQSAYLELLAPGPLRQEAEIWLELIKAARDNEILRRQQAAENRGKDKAVAALGVEKQRLLQKITTLEADNAKLKGDIEKLKFIDLSMEKKRKDSR